MQKLSVQGFALACGIVWSIGVLCVGWTSMFGWGNGFVNVLSTFYIGYAATFVGAIIGGVWAFFDGLVGGAIFAWLYNKLVK